MWRGQNTNSPGKSISSKIEGGGISMCSKYTLNNYIYLMLQVLKVETKVFK